MTINYGDSKHEIKKIDSDNYGVSYYEFYTACGWRKIGSSEVYNKAAVEWQFDIIL